MKNQDGDTGCTADVLGQVRMTRMYEGGGCVWFTNDILIRTHPGAYINTKVHTYIQLVVATVQEKLFKRKYRFKSQPGLAGPISIEERICRMVEIFA